MEHHARGAQATGLLKGTHIQGFFSITLATPTTVSTDQPQGIPCLLKCGGVLMAGIISSVRNRYDQLEKGCCYHHAHNRQRNHRDELAPCGVEVAGCCDTQPTLCHLHTGKNVPHLSHLGPMTSAKELIAWRENSEHNCSCTLLFLRVSKDKVLGDGIMKRAYLLEGRVGSVIDHCIRVPTRIGSLACCNQCSLPISNCAIQTKVVPE